VDDVVIDEWIIVRALALEHDPTQSDVDVPKDFRPAELLALMQEIVEVYMRRLYQVAYRGTLWRRIRASIYGVIGDLERRTWLTNPPVVEGEYHHKDRRWVSAAAARGAGCRLVTGDDDLVSDITTHGIAAHHRIVPMGLPTAHRWAIEHLTKQP
jgi:hypothetical protein